MIRLFYDISVTMEVLPDKLGGFPGVTHERSTIEAEKARVGKVLTEALMEKFAGLKRQGVLIAGVGLKAVDCREEGGPPDGGGPGGLIGENVRKTEQPRQPSRDLLQSFCDLADAQLKYRARVTVEREPPDGGKLTSPNPLCWVVRVEGGPARIEVRHPDYRVALGMAASALDTEGV
jgi:hypothetical protein